MKVEIKEAISVGERVFKAPVMVFETLKEAIADAGDETKLLAKINGWGHAHGSAADIRDLIMEATEEVSKVKPTESPTGRKDSKGNEIKKLEDVQPYVRRVIAAKPDLFDKVQALVEQRAKGYSYKDENGQEVKVPALAVSLKTRPPGQKGPKKLADKWKEVALNFITGKKSLEKFNKALSAAGLSSFVFAEGVAKEDPKNVEALGWLCKAYQDAQDAFKNM